MEHLGGRGFRCSSRGPRRHHRGHLGIRPDLPVAGAQTVDRRGIAHDRRRVPGISAGLRRHPALRTTLDGARPAAALPATADPGPWLRLQSRRLVVPAAPVRGSRPCRRDSEPGPTLHQHRQAGTATRPTDRGSLRCHRRRAGCSGCPQHGRTGLSILSGPPRKRPRRATDHARLAALGQRTGAHRHRTKRPRNGARLPLAEGSCIVRHSRSEPSRSVRRTTIT